MSASKQENLSSQFSKYMGKANLKNPGNPSNMETFYLQQSLVEAHCAYEEAKQGHLRWVAGENSKKSMNPGSFQLSFTGPQTGNPLPRTNENSLPKTYVNHYQMLHTCDSHTAVTKLASSYGLDCTELFGLTSSGSQNVPRNQFIKENPSDGLSVNFEAPDCMNIDGLTYNRSQVKLEFISAPKGLVLEVLSYFSANEEELQIPLHIEKVEDNIKRISQHKLQCGLGKGPLPLYNHNYIDTLTLESATVFLCEDLRVASILSSVIMDSKKLGEGKHRAMELYVATGWYGGARLVDHVDFKPLWNKRIVFIPAINRSSYTDTIKVVMNYCLQAETKDFRIYWPGVLKSSPNYDAFPLVNEISDPWERRLAKSAVVLRDCESQVVRKMAEEAISWDDYRSWGESVGLFPPEIMSLHGSFSKTHTLPQLREHFPLGQNTGVRLDILGTYNNMAAGANYVCLPVQSEVKLAPLALMKSFPAMIPIYGG